ncbi:ribonuclease HII [Kocuria sp.]|uniref:ribonuclease HII n=1 Tax=Kocuria sp. TaxID=1871328 RepID=UPI0026DFD7F5|nr:ribonuclease HII [Kocuria sp.]MDO5618287.1 ribonuclease HII [Kocuria sp.]
MERAILGAGQEAAEQPNLVAGMDEVGRGALAGPVTVGVAVVGAATVEAPARLRDSKLLRPAVRQALLPELADWALCLRTGSASPAEIDALGIIAALRLAGGRALASIPPPLTPQTVLLDGVHDWLTDPQADLFTAVSDPVSASGTVHSAWNGRVQTVVKGDLHCASIAAASVVAKVERDQAMVELAHEFPHYGWAGNKGYGAAAHRAALIEHGVSEYHRRSWKLGV